MIAIYATTHLFLLYIILMSYLFQSRRDNTTEPTKKAIRTLASGAVLSFHKSITKGRDHVLVRA